MVSELLPRFWSVGARTTDLSDGVLVHRPGLVSEPSATYLRELRPTDVAALDGVLDRARLRAGSPITRLFLDTDTPAWVEAELVARDWRVEANLQLVLPAGAQIAPVGPEVSIRPARDDDWEELHTLFRADHEEEDRKAGREPRALHRTEQVVEARRALAMPVQYFLAEVDGIAGFVASWPGDGSGIGLVEDVFVRQDHRRQGLATALIGRAVEWAREGGGRSVVIGAEPHDTPKHLYARLGFVPTAMLRTATAPGS